MAQKAEKGSLLKFLLIAIIVSVIASAVLFSTFYTAPNPATHADIDLSSQKETPIESEEKQHEEQPADSDMLKSLSDAKNEMDIAWKNAEEWIDENGVEGDSAMLENYRNEYESLCREAENPSGYTLRQAGETVMNINEFIDNLNDWIEMER